MGPLLSLAQKSRDDLLSLDVSMQKNLSSVAHFRVEVVYSTVSTLVDILGIQL